MKSKTAKVKAAKIKPSPAPARVAAFNNGIHSETRAADYLLARGYEILARRYKTPHGEVDLVAQSDKTIVFVEVKARARLDDAAYAVTLRQQRRIIDAARAWLSAHPEHDGFDLRFDVLLIAPKGQPRHLIAAFDASE